jgi:hypothetical protein
VDPEPALAPVTVPVIVPIVHEKVLDTVAAKVILVFDPEQMPFVFAVVIVGVAFTVTVTGLIS